MGKTTTNLLEAIKKEYFSHFAFSERPPKPRSSREWRLSKKLPAEGDIIPWKAMFYRVYWNTVPQSILYNIDMTAK